MPLKRKGILSILTIGDLLVMGFVFVLSSVGLYLVSFRGETGGRCIVEVDGKRMYEIPLSLDRRFEVRGPLGLTQVEVKEDSVSVVDSPCPLKLCVKTGRINRTNEMICCVPNRVVVRVDGGRGDVDAVTW